MCKKYVKVTATFDCDGSLVPNYIFWDDNKRYKIDRISDVRYPHHSRQAAVAYAIPVEF